MPNHKPMFEFLSGERIGNAQVFATHDEAWGSANDRFSRWTMPTAFGVDETDDPINYTWNRHSGDTPTNRGGNNP